MSHRWRSLAAVIALTLVAGSVGGGVPSDAKAATMFIGDYSTGDFRQWASVQNPSYNGPGRRYVPTYSARVVDDPVKGKAARFEVRSGDWPGFAGGERSDVGSDARETGGTEGQTRWYTFSTMFDPSFPQNHADLGWGVTNGWHPDSAIGSSGFEWVVGSRNGFWSLVVDVQTSPGVYVGDYTIFETPMNVGSWHDVKMQVNWSTDPERGWIRLWLNGARQRFADGSDTHYLATLVPGTTTCYYKEGYYRKAAQPTGVVYHAGFRAATDEADL
ncbi:heparin lyase I family protein [Mycobacterium sp. SMC-4]|uniref:heparin lyase I family protein n=1 Tax=Mycobacterium sp. SMC-4 TaxID=2857059 RepID=UPI003CFC1405